LRFSLFLLISIFTIYIFQKSDIPQIDIQKADTIIIEKSLRKLSLLKEGKVFKSYKISLGREPIGDKMREGDGKTPEGEYTIDWRNPKSKFHLSLHISYPSQTDLNFGKTGSNIMIHGLPNGLSVFDNLYFKGRDWTEGCIAVSNIEIEEIWNSVENGTKILIEN